MRILYVEDNATNVTLVQRVAAMGKHEVITYDDGQTALDRIKQDKPDLILLDVQLRGALTGLDVAQRLRSTGCILPIIAVTAYAMKGDRQRCLDAGCDDYLAKPVSVTELVTVFKHYGDAVAAGKPILSMLNLSPLELPLTPVLPPTPSTTQIESPAPVSPVDSMATPIPKQNPSTAPVVSPVPVTAVDSIPIPVPPETLSTTPENEVKPTPVVQEAVSPVIQSAPVMPSDPVVTPVAPVPVHDVPPTPPQPDPMTQRASTPIKAEP